MTFTTLRCAVVAAACAASLTPALAQLVYIPDTELRTVLNAWVPGCVDGGGYLDPDAPAVLTQNQLVVLARWANVDLTGLEALDQLGTLVIQSECYTFDNWHACDAPIINVAAWPPALTSLTISRGTYPSIPNWPAGLQELTYTAPIGHSSLPVLPGTLEDLSFIAGADLVTMPDLPAGLLALDWHASAGVSIPALPAGLQSLIAYGAAGVDVPALPSGLNSVFLRFFDASSLPPWPDQLTSITIQELPNLEALPAIPEGVESVGWVALPLISQLPDWPSTLQSAFIAVTPVISLPEFPAGLTHLDISFLAELHCLPLLPDGLATLYFDIDGIPLPHTAVTCLPNLPFGMEYHGSGNMIIPLDPSMLCTVLNSTCDFVNPAATGAVYWDQNANGTQEGGEPGYPYATVNVQPGNYTYSVEQDGSFELPLPLDSYTLTASSSNPYVQSIAPASQTAPFVNATDVDSGNDFAVVLQANMQDLRIDLEGSFGRPGFDTPGWITYENYGTVVMNGTVELQLDADQTWVGSQPTPSSVVGNTITWSYTDLQVGETRTIHLTVHTDDLVPLGTALQHVAIVGPVAGDETPTDNQSVSNTTVVGSIDPNDKRVEPATLTPVEAAPGAELIYTVRFQNTGTYQTDRVLIADTLSADLQWNTLRLVASSHPCTWVLLDNGVVRFTFDPIQLPFSAQDEAGSHGFVKFGMETVPGLPLDASIANIANIVFDFNEAIVTEPAVFSVQDPVGLSENGSSSLRIHPNPASSTLWIQFGDAFSTNVRVEVLDLGGRVLHESTLRSSGGFLHVATLPAGLYQLRLSDVGRTMMTRFVKD